MLVAIKMTKDDKGADDLLQEAILMQHLGKHVNLVNLVGVVTAGTPMMVLVTYCEHGDLLKILRAHAKDGTKIGSPLEPLHRAEGRLKTLFETAAGMDHVSNRFVHRDLAARNVLVDSALVCKVAGQ